MEKLAIALLFLSCLTGFVYGEEAFIQFYLHDTFSSGDAQTTVKIAEGPNTANSTFQFGAVWMADNPLTEEQDPSSQLLGRAQGIHASSGQQASVIMLVTNIIFTAGQYNGSGLTLIGRVPTSEPLAETPIVGGTGVFRLARGYATSQTVFVNSTTNDAIAQFNVTVTLASVETAVERNLNNRIN